MQHVLFSGDLHRPRPAKQYRNTRALYRLLSPTFRSLDLQISLDKVKNTHNLEEWSQTLLGKSPSRFIHYNLEETLVVGFEMNPSDLSYLTHKNIPWLNIEIHPLRFLDDLCFSIQSSPSYDFGKLSEPESSIQLAVAQQKQLFHKKFQSHKSITALRGNSLLILGQTPVDKSVFFNGSFKSLTDYLEPLKAISQDYDHIYYRPHPLADSSHTNQIIYETLQAQSLVKPNFYHLLASEKISAVTGISSSTLHEAQWFEKQVFFLEPKHKKFTFPINLNRLLGSVNEWGPHLMGASHNSHTFQEPSKSDTPIPPNTLRRIYGGWSFNSMNEDKS